ncbi:pseudouridine-5'-phosphate glycosidase [Streptomyces sp. NPDC002835]
MSAHNGTDLYATFEQVPKAVASEQLLVSTESSGATHGLPRPANVVTVLGTHKMVREDGVAPARAGIASAVAGMEARLDGNDQPENLKSCEPASHLVPVDRLQPADSPRRAGEDEEHVQRLVESETEWPPILVHRATHHVIDGMHRLRAAKQKGHDFIRVEFFDGSEEEAFVEAVRVNTRHGLPLSLEDRRSAAERIIASRQDMSDRRIAECAGLSAKTVGNIRRRLNPGSSQQDVRVGKDGRRRPLSSADGRRLAAEALSAEPLAPLRHIAKVAGVSLGTAHDVRERMRRGEDPVTRGDRRRPRTSDARDGSVPQVTDLRVAARERENMRTRLQSLQRDPSLRSSESGRELLRWLHLHQQVRVTSRQVVQNLPPHLAASVAELAIQCSETWRSIAREVQERANVGEAPSRPLRESRTPGSIRP